MIYNIWDFLDPDDTQVEGELEVYKQERIVLYNPDGEMKITTPFNEVVSYVGIETYADITDIVRAYWNRGMLALTVKAYNEGRDSEYVYVISMQAKGLINPRFLNIPRSQYGEGYITPPRRILTNGKTATQAEMWGLASSVYSTNADTTLNASRTLAIGLRKNAEIGAPPWKQIIFIRPELVTCGIVLVRWVACTGVTRSAFMFVKKQKIKSTGAYSLMPKDNEFIEIKGREESLTLWLDKLTPYDIWYYGDMITSSKVELSFDDGATYRRVEVGENNVTIPDGDNGNGVLEIGVIWRRYDAVI